MIRHRLADAILTPATEVDAFTYDINAVVPGDLVMLKGGGPHLTISRVEGDDLFVCWIDAAGWHKLQIPKVACHRMRPFP